MLKTVFREEFSNIDKKIHINDVIKYLSNENIKNFKNKVFEILNENSFIFEIKFYTRQKELLKKVVFSNWQETIKHYGSI